MAAYKGSRLSDGTPLNVAVYKAYRNAGLSHNQALAITAEVGRENSFNASTLFGNHTDPARTKSGKRIRNLGMLSWNQGRDNMLEGYLKKNGVMRNGVMDKTQANLNAQAQFSVREMKSKRYAPKLKNFFNNPNGSPNSFARELGQNYVVWAYGQNDIKGSTPGTRVPFNWKRQDNARRSHLSAVSSMLGDKTNYASQPQQTRSFERPQMVDASSVKGFKPPQQAFDRPPMVDASTVKGFKAPTLERPEMVDASSVKGFEPPQPSFERPKMIDASEVDGFVPPQAVEQQVLERPPMVDLSDVEGAKEQLSTNNNAMPELEPQDWQT